MIYNVADNNLIYVILSVRYVYVNSVNLPTSYVHRVRHTFSPVYVE